MTSFATDSNSSLLSFNKYDKSAASLQLSAGGTVTPSFTVVDPNNRNWNALAVALKPQSGAGVRPTGLNVTRIVHYFHPGHTGPVSTPFPTNGNAIVVASTQYASSYDITSAQADGHAMQQIPEVNAAVDPQVFYLCSRTPSESTTLTWTQQSTASHFVLYDIAGAASGGATPDSACLDASGESEGVQPAAVGGVAQNITGAGSITTYTDGALILVPISFGTGPASAALTAGMVLDSFYGQPTMDDTDNYDSGDVYSHYLTGTHGIFTFSYSMDNAAGEPAGSNWAANAIAIKPAAAPTGTPRKRVQVIQ